MASLRPDDEERPPSPPHVDVGPDMLENLSDYEEGPAPRRAIGRARSPNENEDESPRRVRVVAWGARLEESLSLRNNGRARLAREGDDEDGEESIGPVRVVLVDNLIEREGHDEDQARRSDREGDAEESASRPVDIFAQRARNGDEEAAFVFARMAAREAEIRARLGQVEIDAHARSLARFELSVAHSHRLRRNRRRLNSLLERWHRFQRGEDYDEEVFAFHEEMILLELEERSLFNQEQDMESLLDRWLEAPEGFDIFMRRWRWPLHMGSLRARPVQPQEPPRSPEHIQEYEKFNRAAGITFTKAVEGLELATALPDFDPKALFLKRVTACIGWAVHGLVFEFVNGKRMGAILVDFGDRSLNLSDESIEKRAGVGWTDIDYGDYIVGMHGDRLADPAKMWFCHTLVLEFSSGKSIRYEAKHEPWRGLPFSYTIPQPCLVYRIAFKYEQGEDMLGLKSSFHLPIKQGNMDYLPPKYKTCVKEILMMGRKIDSDRESRGEKPLGNDVWWRILSMLRGWQLLPPAPFKEEEEEASAEASSKEEPNRGGGEWGSFSQREAERGERSWRGRWGPRARGWRERARERLGPL